jgi:hypothetical protein
LHHQQKVRYEHQEQDLIFAPLISGAKKEIVPTNHIELLQ